MKARKGLRLGVVSGRNETLFFFCFCFERLVNTGVYTVGGAGFEFACNWRIRVNTKRV